MQIMYMSFAFELDESNIHGHMQPHLIRAHMQAAFWLEPQGVSIKEKNAGCPSNRTQTTYIF